MVCSVNTLSRYGEAFLARGNGGVDRLSGELVTGVKFY